MTEQIQDQISAFTDDELSLEECQFLVRRLERCAESRAKALRYATIGAALRGELLGPEPDILRRRLHHALAGITPPTRESPEKRPRQHDRALRPVAGFAIAASVAIVALFTLNAANRGASVSTGPTVAARQPDNAIVSDVPSYVVPQDVQGSFVSVDRAIAPPIRLTNYLLQHGEYAPGIGRTSMYSNVVNDQTTWIVVRDGSRE